MTDNWTRFAADFRKWQDGKYDKKVRAPKAGQEEGSSRSSAPVQPPRRRTT